MLQCRFHFDFLAAATGPLPLVLEKGATNGPVRTPFFGAQRELTSEQNRANRAPSRLHTQFNGVLLLRPDGNAWVSWSKIHDCGENSEK
jgi:hypothetical protein